MNEETKKKETESLVQPTDLRNNDIESYGQENIPVFNMNRNTTISDFDINNNYSEFNNIGMLPPENNPIKKKKFFNIKKLGVLSVIFFIIVIIGIGIHFYLSKTGNIAEAAIITKNIEINIGEKLSLNLNDYADFKNIKATNCILETEQVNVNKLGKYTFVISCGVNEYKGTINVVDKKAPDVKTKILLKKLNENIDVNDFILECNDASSCQFNLLNFDELKTNIKEEGIYSALIEVLDKKNNKKIINENMIVGDIEYENILDCSYTDLIIEEYEGTYTSNDIVTFKDNYGGTSIIRNSYFLKKKDEYNKLKEQATENEIITIDNFSGIPLFHDDKLLVTIIKIAETNSSDFLGSLYFDDIKEYYEMFDYTCKVY